MTRSVVLKSVLIVCAAAASALLAQVPTPAPPASQAPPGASSAPAAPAPQNALRLIVLDPGHGGTDSGARGPGGVTEKDAVLVIARTVRSELERQGYLVALTREGNENPSFDDRAALANAQRGSVFITLHVSSTGRPGVARAYYFSGTRLDAAEPPVSPQRTGPLRWDQAQLAYAASSRRFADLLQVQLGLKFRGSPEIPAPVVLRQLRSVAAPAVAVEISSVAVRDAKSLAAMAPDLAAAIVRALEAYRPLYEAGGVR